MMTDDFDRHGYIEAVLVLRPPERRGRDAPIHTGYRPNWWLPGDRDRVYASGSVEVIGAREIRPGDSSHVRVYPFAPELWQHVEVGSHLEMCEGATTIGDATVARIVSAPAPVLKG